MTQAYRPGAMRDTLNHAIRRAVEQSGDKVFLDFSGVTHTYAEVDRLATAFAHELAALGVRKGDRVVIFLENSLEAVVGWFAINRLDAIWVPVNTAFRGEFLRHPLSDSGAAIIICENAFVERVLSVADGLPDVKLILARGDVAGFADAAIPVKSLEDHRGKDFTAIPIATDPADLCSLIYTSGTTGPSKGCMISHNYMCHCARRAVEVMALTSDDILWTCLPLFHTSAASGGIAATLIVQARMSVTPRFSLSGFWPEIERSGATVVKIMASMIPLVAEAPDCDVQRRCVGQIRAVVGSPFSQTAREAFQTRFGVRYIAAQQYACTEGYLITSLPYGEESPPGSSGRRNEYFEVKVVDDEEREVPPGTPGEVLFRPRYPNTMFEGYWRRPEATREVWRNLWMHTGDIGKFDEQGYFYFVDRKKDYIRRRGENISSWEMESAILRHEAVREVAFHSVFSPLGEDDVKITVVPEQGAEMSAEALWRWTVRNVPHFAVPRYIEFREELPRNGVGRVMKYKLREEGCTPATWDREREGLQAMRDGTVKKVPGA